MITNLSTVIASKAKQSIGTAHSVTMDCFVASFLAMTEEAPGSDGYISARGDTPTPALPRKRERERSERLVTLFARSRGVQRTLLPLSRLRGRVARASARDGWGLLPQIQTQGSARKYGRPE
jgi:hypothetical protein